MEINIVSNVFNLYEKAAPKKKWPLLLTVITLLATASGRVNASSFNSTKESVINEHNNFNGPEDEFNYPDDDPYEDRSLRFGGSRVKFEYLDELNNSFFTENIKKISMLQFPANKPIQDRCFVHEIDMTNEFLEPIGSYQRIKHSEDKYFIKAFEKSAIKYVNTIDHLTGGNYNGHMSNTALERGKGKSTKKGVHREGFAGPSVLGPRPPWDSTELKPTPVGGSLVGSSSTGSSPTWSSSTGSSPTWSSSTGSSPTWSSSTGSSPTWSSSTWSSSTGSSSTGSSPTWSSSTGSSPTWSSSTGSSPTWSSSTGSSSAGSSSMGSSPTWSSSTGSSSTGSSSTGSSSMGSSSTGSSVEMSNPDNGSTTSGSSIQAPSTTKSPQAFVQTKATGKTTEPTTDPMNMDSGEGATEEAAENVPDKETPNAADNATENTSDKVVENVEPVGGDASVKSMEEGSAESAKAPVAENAESTATEATPSTSESMATEASPSTSTPAATEATPSTSASTATEAIPSTSASTATEATPSTSASTATEATPSTSASTATEATPSTSASTATEATPSTSASTATEATPSTSASTATEATPSTSASTATEATPSTSASTATEATPSTSTSEGAQTGEGSSTQGPSIMKPSDYLNEQEISSKAFERYSQYYDEMRTFNESFLFAAVIDGHGGEVIADIVKRWLGFYVKKQLMEKLRSNDYQILPPSDIVQSLEEAHIQLDNDILRKAKEYFFKGDVKYTRVGSCSISVLMDKNYFYVSNLGDSKGLLIKKDSVVRLNNIQNASEIAERMRLVQEHPDEDDVVMCKRSVKYGNKRITEISNLTPQSAHFQVYNVGRCYVKGRLQCTRSFGDFYLKQKLFSFDYRKNRFLVKEPHSFPYISAIPEVLKIRRTEDDEFLVLLSDGISDHLSEREIYDIVKDYSFSVNKISQILIQTVLAKAALHERMTPRELLMFVPLEKRRKFFDDMSVVIIKLK
ncbi:putative Protein phosphatase 2C [Plasmodium knowlesi]|uniref:PPM-type phosphatase domain-containing protein n=1 Tax=Plasmodium knowlesi TaxID=5850 RepID=A0A1Y3DJ43_PLAKN|nr:putative Protein phosphatase 2C [Plasmodium knowlesi]